MVVLVEVLVVEVDEVLDVEQVELQLLDLEELDEPLVQVDICLECVCVRGRRHVCIWDMTKVVVVLEVVFVVVNHWMIPIW